MKRDSRKVARDGFFVGAAKLFARRSFKTHFRCIRLTKNEILDFSVLTSDPCLLQIKRRKTLPYITLFGNIRVHLIVGSA